MAQEYWYGDRDESDVVVSLVRSTVTLNRKPRTNSLDQGATAAGGEGGRGSISGKRKRNTESEQDEQEVSLEDLHLHSTRLRSCSKYFDACLSERWTKASREGSKRMHVTLDVHRIVKYYKACFSRMYVSPLQEIPSIKSALGLLQVASQISYQELVEACVCYLAAVPWSQSDEKRIRNFAMSPYYPSDCSADLSARLGLGFSNTERYNILFKETQEVLRDYFLEGLDANHENARDGFSELLRRIIKEQYHGALLQGFLKEVTTQVGEIICQAEAHLAKEDPFSVDNRVYFCNGSLQDIWWILVELLGVGSARELEELTVDRPTLSALVRRKPTESYMRNMWLAAGRHRYHIPRRDCRAFVAKSCSALSTVSEVELDTQVWALYCTVQYSGVPKVYVIFELPRLLLLSCAQK